MEPHRESTDGSNTSPASTLLSSYSQVFLVSFLQVQIPCYILSSCATSQVRRVVLLRVVQVQHCCLEEDPSRPTISFPWAVLCVVDSLSIAHSSWSLERENARNYETKTSSSYFDVEWFPCSLVRGRRSVPIDWRLHDRKQPTLHTNVAEPPLSVQLWVSKLSKSCQHFLNLLVKEKQLWQVNVLSPRMPLYGTLSLFRTSFAGCYGFPCISLGCASALASSMLKAHPKTILACRLQYTRA